MTNPSLVYIMCFLWEDFLYLCRISARCCTSTDEKSDGTVYSMETGSMHFFEGIHPGVCTATKWNTTVTLPFMLI